MEDWFAEATGRPRLLAQLFGLFAGMALLRAAIGSYGVLSYMVTERRREIGIRMARGVDPASVMRMVLSQGLRLTLIGVVIGVAAAFGMNRVMASLLFGGCGRRIPSRSRRWRRLGRRWRPATSRRAWRPAWIR